jgi:phosphoglycerate dehydrogenase-like enzyme
MKVMVLGEIEGAQQPRFETGVSASDVVLSPVADCLLLWQSNLVEAVGAVERMSSVGWVHSRSAGVPDELLAVCESRNVMLTNGSGAHGVAIAEYVACVLLALSKRLPEMLENQRQRVWCSQPTQHELRGRTVGIIGVGALGEACARVLRPFGVELIGIRRTSGDVPGFDEIHSTQDLPSVLPRLDVLVIAAPLTAATRGLISAPELSLLGSHAILINVGRGAIVDEPALIHALSAGRLGGAALDVYAREPVPADSPLWSTPNLIMSPHCADQTAQTVERALDLFLENLQRWASGQPLRNVVRASVGY